VTGVANMARDLTQKRLELLKEAVPRASRIAVIMNPDDPIIAPQWREVEVAAGRLGVKLRRLEVRSAYDLRRAFQTAVDGHANAVLRLADPLAVVLGTETVDLATKHRLSIMVMSRRQVEAGALMSYFAEPGEYHRQAASHVDRILRGAKAGDLPVEQPTKFDLAINLKTAKALGLTISPSLLLRADRVIE
jgi:putative ABC transport system substrate-binding protein